MGDGRQAHGHRTAAQVSAATATDPAARLEAADEYNRRLAAQQVQIGEIIRADAHATRTSRTTRNTRACCGWTPRAPWACCPSPRSAWNCPSGTAPARTSWTTGSATCTARHCPWAGKYAHRDQRAHEHGRQDLFTRLDELRKDQTFTIGVYGRVLHYRITSIRITSPKDTDACASNRAGTSPHS